MYDFIEWSVDVPDGEEETNLQAEFRRSIFKQCLTGNDQDLAEDFVQEILFYDIKSLQEEITLFNDKQGIFYDEFRPFLAATREKIKVMYRDRIEVIVNEKTISHRKDMLRLNLLNARITCQELSLFQKKLMAECKELLDGNAK